MEISKRFEKYHPIFFQYINFQTPIVLFTPYYNAKNPARHSELVYCLKKNIECSQIESIFLLIDDGHLPEIKSSKIKIIRLSKRATFSDWIELSQKYCDRKISILSNTDIYLDNSLNYLQDIFTHNPKAFIALSRYDKKGQEYTLHNKPQWSQDVWAILDSNHFDASFKKSLHFSLGVPRCDNKIAYIFSINGASIYNPCYHIRATHIHETNLRTYDKYKDKTILGGTAQVFPCRSLKQPSEIQIDIWGIQSEKVTRILKDFPYLAH